MKRKNHWGPSWCSSCTTIRNRSTWPCRAPGGDNRRSRRRARDSTLVAFEAEASRVVDPDSVAPLEGSRTLVVGGLLTVILTPELNALPPRQRPQK